MRLILLLISILNIVYAQNIKVAAAANVSFVLEDIIKAYKARDSSNHISVTIGSSGKLAAQILHGAPYDIFLSANTKYPQNLFKMGVSIVSPKVYSKGVLAIFTTKDINITDGLNILNSPDIKKIAVANPKTAPYGEAAKEALINAKLYKKLKPKFVYGESIGQTLIFTLKAADIGIVAKSLLYSNKLSNYKEGIDFIEINRDLYTPIKQAALLVSNTKEAKDFYNFLFTKEAKEIFRKYGYIVE